MGCTGSKQARHDRRRSPSPLPRSFSMPVHHPAQRKGDSYHLVALTSTTLGSLPLDSLGEAGCRHRGCPHCDRDAAGGGEELLKRTLKDKSRGSDGDGDGFSDEVLKAKAWSDVIGHKIPPPRTPNKTPPNEPEVIDAWEMMAGLEDASPIHRFPAGGVERSFSFHSVQDVPVPSKPKSKLSNGSVSPEPMWMQVGGDAGETDAIITEFDPEVISSFRKAFAELSPQHPFHLPGKSEAGKKSDDAMDGPAELTGLVKSRISAFQERINSGNTQAAIATPCGKRRPPGGEGKVVVYFTSLRGVRRTYEDCCAARVILRSYAVRVDERDVSMDGGFRDELNAILGAGYGGTRLPRVFAGGRYLGGVEELRQMHDAGELWEALEGCDEAVTGKAGTCRGCGDVRFVPCETCNGSCKIYVEEEGEVGEELDGDDGDEEVEAGGFRRCPDCNENGLVRCPICCSC